MAYQYTYADAKDHFYLKAISGACSGSEQFRAWLNEAQEKLADAGNWWGTEWLVQLCLYNGCISLRRYVGTLLGMRMCGAPIQPNNHWENILGPAEQFFGHGYSAQRLGFARPQLSAQNPSPLYRPISGTGGKIIRAVALKTQDYGKTITLFGAAGTGQPLQYMKDGAWTAGLKMILKAPYAATPIKVGGIESVLKDVTQGRVMLYEDNSDVTPDMLRDIAMFEPGETNPQHRRYFMSGVCPGLGSCVDSNNEKVTVVEALVKLEFIPVVNDTDFLLIDNFLALKEMIQSIRYSESGNTSKAGEFELSAIRRMNLRDRNKMPDQQTTVRVRLGGSMVVNPI